MTHYIRATVHRRLALTLALVVVVSGVLLLATSYLLVRANLNDPTLNIKQAPQGLHGAGTAGATGRTCFGDRSEQELAHKTLSTLILHTASSSSYSSSSEP